jgi:hypothetical protein
VIWWDIAIPSILASFLESIRGNSLHNSARIYRF